MQRMRKAALPSEIHSDASEVYLEPYSVLQPPDEILLVSLRQVRGHALTMNTH
jgi:hypothetical protein